MWNWKKGKKINKFESNKLSHIKMNYKVLIINYENSYIIKSDSS